MGTRSSVDRVERSALLAVRLHESARDDEINVGG